MRISRTVQAGAIALAVAASMVALAPLAGADTETVPVGASGSIQTPIPATPGATLSLTVDGQSYTVEVPAQPGGTLVINFSGNTTASVTVQTADCPAGTVGKILTVGGLSSGTQVTASVSSPLTPPTSTDTGSISHGASATASLCATAS